MRADNRNLRCTPRILRPCAGGGGGRDVGVEPDPSEEQGNRTRVQLNESLKQMAAERQSSITQTNQLLHTPPLRGFYSTNDLIRL